MRAFHPWYIRLNRITLILIMLVVIAGSFVRISGSGMGCPDWPTCFGRIIPPTDVSELPANYKDFYSDYRKKKVQKFAKFLTRMGFEQEAEQLLNDPSILEEKDFSMRNTWTEYINRLVGFLAGNGVLFVLLWTLIRYPRRKLIWLTLINLILIGIEAWFGSIVVATNLVPWTITVHLFLALIIIGIQVAILAHITQKEEKHIKVSKAFQWLIWVSLIITFVQMFLGTQVREYIDQLTKAGIGRDAWTDQLGMSFFVHRSFSWLVLILMAWMVWINYKSYQYRLVYIAFALLMLEILGGIMLAYADMPGLVQTSHLVFACILFALLYHITLRFPKSLA